MKLYKVQIWTMVHGLRTSRPELTPQYNITLYDTFAASKQIANTVLND